MKLTKREKTLLFLLGIVIVCFILYKFIITPQWEKLDRLSTELNDAKSKKAQLLKQLSPENKVHSDYKILNAHIYEATYSFFPSIIQQKIILILDSIIKESNIKAQNISFSAINKTPIEQINEVEEKQESKIDDIVVEYESLFDESKKRNNQKTSKPSDEKKDESLQLDRMLVNLDFESDYESLMKTIKQIEDYDKNIIIESISINNSLDGSLQGTMSLGFYAIPKMHQQDDSYIKWDLFNSYGKDNPFGEFDGYNASVSRGSDNGEAKPDFIMTVSPISTDFPTIIIGKSGDTARESYIYADNAAYENIEFKLSYSNGKYYYKYKTEQESYPKAYSDKPIEFKPNGKNITLEVYSNERSSEKDKSGTNLSLINDTDLNFNIKIIYDDATNPRVKIAKKSGNVNIIK